MNKNIFDNSEIKRLCRLCQGEHGIGYVTYTNNSTHMTMYCSDRRVWHAIAFEPGLNIPSVLSEPAKKHNQKINDMKQSVIFEYMTKRNKKNKDSLPNKIKPYGTN